METLVVILIIIILVCLVLQYKPVSIEGFGVFIKDIIIPTQCYDYLVTDGSKYYLMNSRKLYDGVNNPKEFNNIDDAYKYCDSIKCQRVDLIDLVTRKNQDDPQVTMERMCAKRVATNLFDSNVCSDYTIPWDSNDDALGGDALKYDVWDSISIKLGMTPNDKKTFEKIIKDVKRDFPDMTGAQIFAKMTGAEIFAFVRANRNKLRESKEYTDYNIETCMIDMAAKGMPGIDDPIFKSRFETYFNHLNQNIPDEYLPPMSA